MNSCRLKWCRVSGVRMFISDRINMGIRFFCYKFLCVLCAFVVIDYPTSDTPEISPSLRVWHDDAPSAAWF